MKYLFIISLFLLLLTRLFFYYQERHIYKENESLKETYSFTHEAKENSGGQYFFVNNILVTLPLFPKYHYGDKIEIAGKVEMLQTKKGDLLAVKNPYVKPISNDNLPLAIAKFVRQRIQETVLSTIPAKEGGLLLGIILGVRDKIDNSFYEQLRNAGVLHVIAASGQNVSIVASLLLLTLERVVKRRLALLFTSVGVLFYAFLAGFDPSIVRAAIMAMITFGALAFGRQSRGLYALFATAYIMVFLNPGMIEDVSFQLSALSTFGILTVKPLIDRVVHIKFISILKDDITTTLSAQVATLPIMFYMFGSYSLVSLPVNILLLWTVPILMIFGGLGALVSLVFPLLGVPFFLISYPFLVYFTGVIGLFSNININISTNSWPITLVFGYYLILLGIVIRLQGRERRKI